MKTPEYDARIAERGATPAAIAARNDAARLAEIARNQASRRELRELAAREPVNEGDRVIFGKYTGNDVKIEGEDALILREDDILGVIEG